MNKFFLFVHIIIGDKMIYNYEIKMVNGEEKLFLYLDLNYEFANLDFKTKKKSLEKAVNEFIIKNKIIYKGSLVSLIVGGILVGDLLLKQPALSKQSNIIEEITPKIVEVDSLMKIPELPKIEEEIEIIDVEDNNSNQKATSNVNINTSKKTTSSNTNVSKKETKQENNTNQTVKAQEEVKQEFVDNNIYVNVKRSNGQLLKIELEEYLIGVVGSEMPALFNIEALKAQAVVSRTYTLKAISLGKTLTDNESTQTYKSKSELQSMWGSNFNTYYSKIEKAVNETKGEYLTYNGKYIEAVFHSTSNTRTEDASNVWGNSYPYLVSVDSPYDTSNPSYEVEKSLTYSELSQKLGIEVNSDTLFTIMGKTVGNRVSQISVGDKVFTGVEFRSKLGLRSTDFEIEKTESGIKIKTRGYGHGVGMSQYGANGMANNGSNYQTILKHYYRGVNINRI